MFVVLLRFAENKARAGEFMEGHNHWLQQGFDDGLLLLSGSLGNSEGGMIVAKEEDRGLMERFVASDPFVREGVVTAEIIEFSASRASEDLAFLIG